ncbi:MAG: hypothetical protein MR897_03645 [Bacteroidales bacterium]|nr:hypothetical protein [Bacteroidales bacterium]MDY3008901.1 hypothetical protein [Sodaliphilus sp.]MCI6562121.1 hypothetical protein [Bacteroidales bacterium]MCI6624898.1 hypothetical protein [Bacteroidales bacterium]MCI7032501.1 hypothetical protein [Bacteroidales bacterium]
MKKFFALTLLLFASVFASHAYAEVFKLRAYSASMRSTDRYGNWSDWTDWSDCNILVVSDDSRVKIYSEETQEYDIISSEEIRDSKGVKATEFHCVDKNGLRCSLRLRVEKNDNIQLYVDYNDISFVYNVYILK